MKSLRVITSDKETFDYTDEFYRWTYGFGTVDVEKLDKSEKIIFPYQNILAIKLSGEKQQ